MRINCSFIPEDSIKTLMAHDNLAVIVQVDSEVMAEMGESQSVALNLQGVDDLIYSLQTLKGKLK